MKYTNIYIKNLIAVLQEMEEIGGPDTREQYIAVLTAVKLEIDKRIAVATQLIIDDSGEE